MKATLFLLFSLLFSIQLHAQSPFKEDSSSEYFQSLMDSISDAPTNEVRKEMANYLKWEATNQERLLYCKTQYARHIKSKNVTEAKKTFDKCKHIYYLMNDTANYLRQLNVHISFLSVERFVRESLDLLTEYHELALKHNDERGVMYSYYAMGRCYYLWADYTTAIHHFINAINYGEKHQLNIAHSFYHNAAACARLADHTDLALEYQFKALEKFKPIQDEDKQLLISMQSNILQCYIIKKDSIGDAPIDSLYQTIKQTRAQYGQLHEYHQNRYDNAMLYYYMDFKNQPEKAANYFNDGAYLISKLNKARIYYAMDEFKQSAENYKLAYEIIRENQTKQINLALDNFVAQNGYDKMKSEMNELRLRETEEKIELDKKLTSWQWAFFILAALIIIFYLINKIRHHKMEEKRLKIEKENAIKAEQTKSLFLQNMSHEIRTPLNAIVGFNDLLNGELAETLDKDEKLMMVDMIKTNVDLLQTLVSDVLDMSKFESGTYKVHYMDINTEQLCKTVLESIRPKANANVNVELECGESDLILHTDAQRVQQVLSNFLTNACKYTTEGAIKLSYHVDNDTIRFSVTDTGVGIKPEEAEMVFHRFKMLDKATKGTGLGLHICSLIANLLNGKVYVDTTYKKGARFVFELPMIKP